LKIRNRKVIGVLGRLAALGIRGWFGTVRFRHRSLGPNVNPLSPGFVGHYLYTFWHEYLLVPASQFVGLNVHVLSSKHADGQLSTETCQQLGFKVIRGSSTRGGTEALRQLIRVSRSSHLAITPDGPRGPRRHVQPGVIFLAARTGMPMVPCGIGVHHGWRANSWDRLVVPIPFTRVMGVWGEPILVPPKVAREGLEEHRLRLEQAMGQMTGLAECWARTGTFPEAAAEAVRLQRWPGAA
jgi:lysophospholipid acyltransferase (LPLAT)-like uncharacterized protein